MRLLDHAKKVYSQCGEDGILSKILEILPEKNKWCVEFGAWDGQYLSNTCNLIRNCDYSVVLVEADRKRFGDLLKQHGSNPKVIALNRFVGFTSAAGLDNLLTDHHIPEDFDVLSIDIDGNDYHVWNAVSSYAPKVICIEYNPTIPTEIDFVQKASRNLNQGASLLALTRLARQKGYELVCVTSLNAIFVRSVYLSLFGIRNNDPRLLREDLSLITHIFCGYDGTILLRGRQSMPWHHGIRYEPRIRQLPKMFREYPENFGRCKSVLFKAYRKFFRVLH
jgi:hypothetical protein